jgi:retron-type reverse transcriptase
MLEGIEKLAQLEKNKKNKYINLIQILSNETILIAAYSNIKGNKGANTPGIDKTDTLDGFNKDTIQDIQKGLNTGSYEMKPARTIEIPKPKGGFRRLGIPSPKDKIVQEAIRLILNSIYEPIFSDSSHGFRPKRSCHTALEEIRLKFGEKN